MVVNRQNGDGNYFVYKNIKLIFMTKTELTTQIGYDIRTASRNFVSEDEILSKLNRVIEKLSGQVDLVTTIVESTISFTGNGSYNLPSDFKKVISVFDRNNKIKYNRASVSQLRTNESLGKNIYAIKGSTILIDSEIGSATLTLTYYSTYDCFTTLGVLRKGLSASTDYPALQNAFHDYLIEKTDATIFRKERKYDDYKISIDEARDIFKNILAENPSQEEKIISLVLPYAEVYN